MKINNVLQAYFRYRIELNRKGQELTTPQRQAINDKSGKTSDDEYKSWQFATHIKTFQLRYDTNNNYQIPLSIKLLELEETNHLAWFLMGKAKRTTSDPLGAIADLTRAIALKEDFTDA